MHFVKSVNKEEFKMIMNYIGLKKDNNLVERLYWLFDLNGDGNIDYNEITYSINLFKENSLEENI